MIKKITKQLKKVQKQAKALKKGVSKRFNQKPLAYTGAIIGLLFVTIIASRLIPTKTEEPQVQTETPLAVQTLELSTAKLSQTAPATAVNKSTLTLVAQSAGPVSNIYVKEGQQINRGAWLLMQETAYTAGNIGAVGRQIAAKNLELAEESLKNTADQVSKTREIADKSFDSSDELRKISENSISGTRRSLDLTRDVITKLESDLEVAIDPDAIAGIKQQLISYQGIYNQTETALKNLEYSTNTDNEPFKLSELNKDTIYLATEIQLKAAQIQKDIAALSVRQAAIQEALSHVSAPIAGRVERIMVTPGQYLAPGTPVMVIKGADQITLEAKISGETATRINTQSSIELTLGDDLFNLPDYHVSAAPISSGLYEIIVSLPGLLSSQIIEGNNYELSLPMYTNGESLTKFYVPLDSVYVTNTTRFVYILEEGQAVKRTINTGSIVGDQIEVKSGLTGEDILVLDRRVLEGQQIESTQ